MSLSPASHAQLTAAAQRAAAHSYSPYSRFAVGAALLLSDGSITAAANVENSSYGLSSCAERNALFRAIAEHGPARRILAAAVFHNGPQACPPCGACLQVLTEFAAPGCIILFSEGAHMRQHRLDELFPTPFNAGSL
jgi:cytidine deaminase